MQKIKKKTLSILLTVVMILSMLTIVSASVFADDTAEAKTLAVGEIFKIGEPILVPAGTLIQYHLSGSQHHDSRVETFSADTLIEAGASYGSQETGWISFNNRLRTGVSSTNEYLFTGYYTIVESVVGTTDCWAFQGIYYNSNTYPEWSTWEVGDTSATATLTDFYIYEGSEVVSFPLTQTIDAELHEEVVSEGNCQLTRYVRCWFVATACDYTAASTTQTGPNGYGPHDLQHQDEQPATCTATGWKESWWCAICYKYFSDPDGMNEYADNDRMISKLPHTFSEESDYRLGEEGSTVTLTPVDHCTVCNNDFDGDSFPVTHYEAAQPTAVNPGNYEYCLDENDGYYRATDIEGVYKKVTEDDVIIPVNTYEVDYIDETGEPATVNAASLTGRETILVDGWYVAENEVTFDRDVALEGDVKIILADGCDLTVNRYLGWNNESGKLTVYCQSRGSGKLTTDTIEAEYLNFIGGVIAAKRVDANKDILIGDVKDFTVDARQDGILDEHTGNAVVSKNGNITITGGSILIWGNTAILAYRGSVTKITGGDVRLHGYGSGIWGGDVDISGGTVYAYATDGYGIHAYDGITLSWSNNSDEVNVRDQIYATGYSCKGGTVKLVKPFKDADGVSIFAAGTVPAEDLADKYLIPASQDEFTVTINGVTGSFNEMIRLNFYFDIPQGVLQDLDAYVTLTNENTEKETKLLISDAEFVEDKGYKFSIPLAAKEASDPIVARIFDGQNNALMIKGSSGTDYTENGFDQSLMQYFDWLKESGENNEKELGAAAKDYCTAAQIYFDYNAEDLEVSDAVDAVDLADLDEYIAVREGELPEGVSIRGITAMLEADNTLRLYLGFENDDPTSYTFTISDESVDIKQRSSDNAYYLALDEGVYSNRLQSAHYYTVSDGENTYTIKASVLTYARAMAKKKGKAESDLGKALYLYNRAAVERFGE